MSSVTGSLSVLKIQRGLESYLKFLEDNSDSMHTYLEPSVSEFAKNLSAGDCFADPFNSRVTVNTALVHLNEKLRSDVVEFDRLGYGIDTLRSEIAALESQVADLETTEAAMRTDLRGYNDARDRDQEVVENLKQELSRLRVQTTNPGSSLEDFQERATTLRREGDAVKRIVRDLEKSVTLLKREIDSARLAEVKLERDISRIVIS